jgi:hypothetical protein
MTNETTIIRTYTMGGEFRMNLEVEGNGEKNSKLINAFLFLPNYSNKYNIIQLVKDGKITEVVTNAPSGDRYPIHARHAFELSNNPGLRQVVNKFAQEKFIH